MMASVKKQVQAAFFDAGLALEREALSTFVAFIEENGGEEELIYSLLDSIVQGGPSPALPCPTVVCVFYVSTGDMTAASQVL